MRTTAVYFSWCCSSCSPRPTDRRHQNLLLYSRHSNRRQDRAHLPRPDDSSRGIEFTALSPRAEIPLRPKYPMRPQIHIPGCGHARSRPLVHRSGPTHVRYVPCQRSHSIRDMEALAGLRNTGLRAKVANGSVLGPRIFAAANL